MAKISNLPCQYCAHEKVCKYKDKASELEQLEDVRIFELALICKEYKGALNEEINKTGDMSSVS